MTNENNNPIVWIFEIAWNAIKRFRDRRTPVRAAFKRLDVQAVRPITAADIERLREKQLGQDRVMSRLRPRLVPMRRKETQ